MIGYDVIQGALAPALRLQCHGVMILLLSWLLLQFLPVLSGHNDDDDPSSSTWIAILYACLFYGFGCLISSFAMDGVSMPAGPRKYRLQRTPQWKNVWTRAVGAPAVDTTTTAASNAAATSTATPIIAAQCLTAHASHEYTQAQQAQAQQQKLSGEAVGRQIWVPATTATTVHDTSKTNVVSQILRVVVGSGGGGSGTSSSSNNTAKQQVALDEKAQQEIQIMAQAGRTEFGFNPAINPNASDMIFRQQQITNFILKQQEQHNGDKSSSSWLPTMRKQKAETVQESTNKAATFLQMLQCEDGHFAADYGGPHFLLPGLIIAWYIMGKPESMLSQDFHIPLMKHYILVHQQVDGGWGTHLESPSTMFGSTLMYVALRLLGLPPDHPACQAGREFLLNQGGALYTSSWSKFYLCLLGVMDWKGHNSVPPEMWLLPNWCPFHPGRMWCHARMVYLPMGYLYGKSFVFPQAETDPLIQDLRQELYTQDYATIDWMPTRHWVAPMDNYSPIPWIMKTLQNILARYENWKVFDGIRKPLREKGCAYSMDYIRAEDLQTNYINIGPVNKVLNMICHFAATEGNLEDPQMVNHIMRVPDYLWVAEDGMKMQGYNGSQCWDTSFCAQALHEAQLMDDFGDMSRKMYSFLERTQILATETSQASPAFEFETNEKRQASYRHISKGGWPFSTSAHGWPISDCTGEGLKATLCLLQSKDVQQGIEDGSLRGISEERLQQAVHILLTYQNEDGGWATYENNRGWGWYEQLNPSEVFGDIMIDYSYVECSMASLTALVDFIDHDKTGHRSQEIQHAIDKGRDFIKSVQRDDGSWYGSWACCFTYGAWFGVEGLVKCGEPLDSPCILDACDFLLKHQRPNGGWGEDFTSCYDKDYAQEGMKAYGDQGSGIVNTCWALLALSIAECQDVDAVRRGVKFLMSRQLDSGDWPQEGIAGVFNRSVGISYTQYRNMFPLWAMGRCRKIYGDELEKNEQGWK